MLPTISTAPLSGRYLSFAEREDIAMLHAASCGVREIARRLSRSPATISRELRRNAATRGGRVEYRASTAQWHAERRARRPKLSKLAVDDRLREYVQDAWRAWSARRMGPSCRALTCDGSDGATGGGRTAAGRPRGAPSRSPSGSRSTSPTTPRCGSHPEAIYQALYIRGRGALARELTACLRTGRSLRVPRARTRGRGKRFVTPDVLIKQRPAEADDRSIVGHWEGDLIIGLDSSAVGTVVERTTRFTVLLHLPRMDEHGGPRTKNGPALAGHGARAVRQAITASIGTMPELWRSLTWDQGAEMAEHVQLRAETGLPVYFCEPRSPWQRGTNENTNGLLRQYFPKGTDLSVHGPDDLEHVAQRLNGRPRKTLDWETPAQRLRALLQPPH